ncbi:MAG TPA: Gfo/Idh/MocA family oxidoreductase, partial [Dehalococcoidia bacterium]|nr:Gfo/Idh/MocA family oxidoreductase [Dehalococcoidia bacterium]
GRILQVSARRLGPFAARTRDVSVIHDLAFHDIDVMRHLLGAEVTRVAAETQTGLRTEYEDSVTGLLRFDSGAVGLLAANWLTPRKSRDLAVLCENGLYVADYVDYRAPTLDFYPSDLSESAGAVSSIAVEACEPLVSELSAFVAAVRDGAPMPVTSDDALGTLAVADALAESARTGKQVTLR